MHTSISFDAFNQLQDAAAHERIRAARARLGKRAVLLCHHYQRADVYQYADLTGDSLKLSRLASQTDSEFIVFCGVHFMAEVADIMSSPAQTAILPDLAAGCSMADMANLAKVERCWRELNEVLGDAEAQVTPVTYINSAADLKAFCGARGGIVCTSSNAGTIAKWAFAAAREDPLLPRPAPWPLDRPQDGHRARRDGGLGSRISNSAALARTDPQGKDPAVEGALLGAPDVPAENHIKRWREQHPQGIVISHPECNFEVCLNSDHVGSTEHIVRTIKEAPPNTQWLVGTELNLVNRLANEVRPEGKTVQFMAPTVCMCSTMQRIDPQHLAWTLENLADGNIVNPIRVPEHEAELAKLALERMLAVS
jgi:quinolinate synthase